MVRLEKSAALGRLIRQDDPEDLAIPNLDLAKRAIQEGKVAEGLALLDYESTAVKACHDSIVEFVDDVLTHIAQISEEELYEVFRRRYGERMRQLLAQLTGPEDALRYCEGNHRAYGGNLRVREESDRYVVTLDPCGSGGQLRRTRVVATVKKAYPWTWGKADVPCYCAHDCVVMEILPTEIQGYPLRIHLIGDGPQDPCVHLFYKRPELIPEEYFTRIGKTKTIK